MMGTSWLTAYEEAVKKKKKKKAHEITAPQKKKKVIWNFKFIQKLLMAVSIASILQCVIHHLPDHMLDSWSPASTPQQSLGLHTEGSVGTAGPHTYSLLKGEH